MTFDANETSTESGQPVELYTIQVGTSFYYYASGIDDFTLGFQTYTAIGGLKRTKTTDGPAKRADEFKLDLPTSSDVAQFFTGSLPGVRVRLTVLRCHRGDTPTPESVTIFDGFVHSAGFVQNGKVCTLVAKPELASLGKQVPRRTYQGACNHVLYDVDTCGVDDTDPAYRAAALSVDSQVGNVLTVAAGLSGLYPDGWMNGGFAELIGGTDFRLIRTHVGDVLTLQNPFSTTPTAINAFAGCAHTVGICKSKFDNVINYGGFPFVPTKNIFETGLF